MTDETQITYRCANGKPIVIDGLYWSNNLDAVRVTKIASWPADRAGDVHEDPYCSPWHETVRLSDGRVDHFDSGRHGRLATCRAERGAPRATQQAVERRRRYRSRRRDKASGLVIRAQLTGQ